MQDPHSLDLFATKGIEYLLVIGFLGVLALFWWRLTRRMRAQDELEQALQPRGSGSWFELSPELYYHPGHSWAAPEPDGTVTVGIDDFAQKLIGAPTALELPQVGERIEQGSGGPRFRIGSKSVDLLSPLDGQVVARNDTVLGQPDLVNRDPYGRGWLLRIAPSRIRSDLATLMHRGLAAAWMDATEDKLRRRMSGPLGLLLQDGGVPVNGIARSIAADDWDEVAREFLLNRWEPGVTGEAER